VKKFLIIIALLLLNFLTHNPVYAIGLSPRFATLYSEKSIEGQQEKLTIFKNTLDLWEKIGLTDFAQTSASTSDGRFSGTLNHSGKTVYLEVFDQQTAHTYYHFLDNTEQLDFSKNSSLRSFSKLAISKINIDDVHFASSFNSLSELQKIYNEQIDQLGKSQGWVEKSVQTLQDITQLYNEALKNWQKVQKTSGLTEDEIAEQLIKHDKIHAYNELLGSGELNMVDQTPFIRVVHKETQLSFIFLKKDSIDREHSKHWRQYLARQHIAAGETRADGQIGRDVVVVELDELTGLNLKEILDPKVYQELKRHKKYSSKAWWQDYWHAIAKKPTLSTAGFGLFSGAAQGAMATAVGLLKTYLDPEQAGDFYAPAKLSMAWGFAITTFVSTYKNWLLLGHKPGRVAKSMLNSVMFYYILGAMTHPDGMAMFNPLELQGLLAHGAVWSGALIANLAKPHWYDIPKIREVVGISRKNFKMKLPWGKTWETKISQAAVENQLIYLIPFTLRLADFLQIKIAALPLGKFLFISSIPLAEYLALKMAVWMARKTRHPRAIEIAKLRRADWRKKIAYFTDSKMRKIINQRLLAKSMLKKDKYNAFSKLLAQKYPEYFTYTRKGHIQHPSLFHSSEFSIPKGALNCLASARNFPTN